MKKLVDEFITSRKLNAMRGDIGQNPLGHGGFLPPDGSLNYGSSIQAQVLNPAISSPDVDLYRELYGIEITPVSPSNLTLTNDNGKILLNGRPVIRSISHYYDKSGNFTHETLALEYVTETETFSLGEMTLRDFKSLSWTDTLPNSAIPEDKRDFKICLTKYVNDLLNDYNGNIIKVWQTGGWQKLHGSYHFLDSTSDIVDCSSHYKALTGIQLKKNAATFQTADNLNGFLKMCQLTKNNSAATLILLYCVTSFFYTIFKEAGFVPKFLIALIGPSGSRKTSLAQCMTQFGDAHFSFWDTAAGLETGFPQHKDAVLLVDDLCPTTDSIYKGNMERNLELISRIYGDASIS